MQENCTVSDPEKDEPVNFVNWQVRIFEMLQLFLKTKDLYPSVNCTVARDVLSRHMYKLSVEFENLIYARTRERCQYAIVCFQ